MGLLRNVLLLRRFLEVDQTILVKQSKYFEGCDSFSSKENIVFDSKIVSFGALQALIVYLETGKLEPKLDDLELLFIAADYLQIDSATALLVVYLHEVVPSQLNVIRKFTKELLLMYLRIYPLVYRYEIKHNYQHITIQDKFHAKEISESICIRFVLAQHFDRIMNEIEILDLDRDCIYELLTSDYLLITERDVLRTIKLWVNYDLNERRKYFCGLTKCIRPEPNLTVCFSLL